ncbi:MAG: glucuronate isomerase [Bacteroidota bacterium]|jgi:glucuronate isomerase
MEGFIKDNFVLDNAVAQELYHKYAAPMPIIDYHCHLPVDQIANNHQFENITQAWLYGDHYKWRAMRSNGVSEDYCTGAKSDWEKFEQWAATVPYTLRNPLYHWTHIELKRYFGIDKILNPSTAREIYDEASAKMSSPEYTTQGLLKKMNVEVVCTTDDPIDSLEHHAKLAKESHPFKVIPAWRPDKAMNADDAIAYNKYIDALSAAAGLDIATFAQLIDALKKRHDFFHANGCRLSDHGLDTFYNESYTEAEAAAIFAKVRGGNALSATELLKFKSAMMYEFAIMDHAKGWTQQFHVGAMRNNNTLLMNRLGADTGFDSIGDWNYASAMGGYLDRLNSEEKLTKTILYNLNPKENEVMATMLGNFQDGSMPGKMQWGSAWWFLDQKDGMEKQINALSVLGLLRRSVGMLTDSRSFLSFPRHEYFRRILCNIIGNDVEKGLLPNDMEMLGQMVEEISYRNAREYFGFYK